MESISCYFYDTFLSWAISESTAKVLNMLILVVALLILILIIDTITRRLLRFFFAQLAGKTKTNFDDILIANKVPRNIAHIIPLVIAIELIPFVFKDYTFILSPLSKIVGVAAIILTLWIVRSILNAVKDYLKTLSNFKDKPIDSYIQVFMIFAWLTGTIFALAYISGVPTFKLLTGLGAVSAVIILIFKDTILGFVASIQVSINDMVRIGDWIKDI